MRRAGKPGLSREEIEARLTALVGATPSFGGGAVCVDCQDTKFVITYRGQPPIAYSHTCDSCPAGRALGEARKIREVHGRASAPQSEDRREFVALFSTLCTQFGKKVERDILEAYWAELQVFSSQEIARGFKHAVSHCKFFPRIAEILDGINGPPL